MNLILRGSVSPGPSLHNVLGNKNIKYDFVNYKRYYARKVAFIKKRSRYAYCKAEDCIMSYSAIQIAYTFKAKNISCTCFPCSASQEILRKFVDCKNSY